MAIFNRFAISLIDNSIAYESFFNLARISFKFKFKEIQHAQRRNRERVTTST